MVDGDIDEATVTQLIRAVEERKKYVFLIGAGSSRPSPAEIPTGKELIQMWKDECYDHESPSKEFDEWVEDTEKGMEDGNKYGFWFKQRHPTRGERRERIQNLVKGAKPTFGHVLLASMMDGDYVPHVLTPNFDDLLFDAFYLYLEDKPQVIDHQAVGSEFRLTHRESAIVKLHGDYLYDNHRNTASETGSQSLDEPMKDALQQTVEEYGLVIVGYSGGDDSIMDPLIKADISEWGIYWCTRDANSFSEDGKAAELLEQSNTYLVDIDGFGSLMRKFGNRIDSLEPPQPDEIVKRAEERADMLKGALEESKATATSDEEEEYVDRMEKVWNGLRFAAQGNYEKAIELYTETIEEDPEFSTAYGYRGNAKRELGEYKGAIADYDKVLELNPDDATAYNKRGITKKAVGEYKAAIADYNAALDLDPDFAQAYYNRGISKQKLGEYEAAISDYDTAIKLKSDYTSAYNNRGTAKKELGEYEAAIADYDTAVELNLDHRLAHQNRAEARIVIGNFEQARRDASQAKEVSESTDDSAKSLLLHLIPSIVLGKETADEESEYCTLCEKEFTTNWTFEELDAWLEDADLESDKKDKIAELIDLLREHKE